MKLPTPTPTALTLTLSAALAFACGSAAFADDTKAGPAHPKSERKAEPAFVRGKTIDGKYTFTDLDGDEHTLKSCMDKSDVLVVSFVSFSDIYPLALLEKDEWINEKTQSQLTERLEELKKVIHDKKIKAADKSVAHVIVVLTHDGFKPSTIRSGADKRTLAKLLEVYFDEHELGKAQLTTTPWTQCEQTFGTPKRQVATLILEQGRVQYVRFSDAKTDQDQGSGAKADAKRLKAQETPPNPGAKADAKRLKAKEDKENPGAKLSAQDPKSLDEIKDLLVALKRIVEAPPQETKKTADPK